MCCISDLPSRWREEAEFLRHRGQEDMARMVESYSGDLELEISKENSELLTIAEAATLSGYSEEHLRRLARSGDLPTTRNGDRGRIQITRGDVPKKPGRSKSKGDAQRSPDDYDVSEDARDIAQRMRR